MAFFEELYTHGKVELQGDHVNERNKAKAVITLYPGRRLDDVEVGILESIDDLARCGDGEARSTRHIGIRSEFLGRIVGSEASVRIVIPVEGNVGRREVKTLVLVDPLDVVEGFADQGVQGAKRGEGHCPGRAQVLGARGGDGGGRCRRKKIWAGGDDDDEVGDVDDMEFVVG